MARTTLGPADAFAAVDIAPPWLRAVRSTPVLRLRPAFGAQKRFLMGGVSLPLIARETPSAIATWHASAIALRGAVLLDGHRGVELDGDGGVAPRPATVQRWLASSMSPYQA